MKPQLGWVWLSQAEREGAEAALNNVALEGSRDELGFGAIHFAYADRFFPGTSVQHTHLRYVFFVCWAFQEAMRRYPGAAYPRETLGEIEDRTGHKLIRKLGRRDNTGIIGIRVLTGGGSPQTKPSTIYWSALRTWGLLADDARIDTTPPQSWVQRRWADYTVPAKGPEVDSVKSVMPLFEAIPEPPAGWTAEGVELDFELKRPEADRIRRSWARAAGGGTLMSRLAETRQKVPERFVARRVMQLCDPAERRSLHLAEQAGSLVGIGRALYGAMVHDLKSNDQQSPDNSSARYLRDAIPRYRESALQLDIDDLAIDAVLPDALVDFLKLIQDWLRQDGDYLQLKPAFRTREVSLKDDRALLLPESVKRRADWSPRYAQPLNYRWDKVSSFLEQLAAAA